MNVAHHATAVLVAFAALVGTPAQSLAQTGVFDIVRLMQLLGSAPGVDVPYTEMKYSSLLSEPVVSAGTLSYRPPDIVEKSMTAPRIESFRMAGDELIVVRNDTQRRFPLSSQPLLAAFAAGLRGVLAGDAALLRRYYNLALAGEEQGWRLEMIPQTDEISRYVRRITVSGRAGRIEQIEVREASGDHSVMQIR